MFMGLAGWTLYKPTAPALPLRLGSLQDYKGCLDIGSYLLEVHVGKLFKFSLFGAVRASFSF